MTITPERLAELKEASDSFLNIVSVHRVDVNSVMEAAAAICEAVPSLIAEIERLREALTDMTNAFRPFTMKPIGGEGSSARIEQEEQIAAHRKARKALEGK
jgi:hypothetical protein